MLLGGFEPFTVSDFPGHPAAVVFTQGCNFRCPFCHNGGLLEAEPTGELLEEEEFLAFLAKRRGLLSGVVISGGEPCLQPDLAAFCRRLKEMGFNVKLDTNGSRPRVIAELLAQGVVDYIAMDVKAPLERYRQLTGGAGNPATISAAIALIAAGKVAHHFRTTRVESLLSDEDISRIKALIPPGSCHRLQPFIAENALAAQLRPQPKSPPRCSTDQY